MADSKIFKLVDGVTIDMVGRAVECFLRDKKALTQKVQVHQKDILCKQKNQKANLGRNLLV